MQTIATISLVTDLSTHSCSRTVLFIKLAFLSVKYIDTFTKSFLI